MIEVKGLDHETDMMVNWGGDCGKEMTNGCRQLSTRLCCTGNGHLEVRGQMGTRNLASNAESAATHSHLGWRMDKKLAGKKGIEN